MSYSSVTSLNEDNKGFAHIIQKESNSDDKILKPDFNQKTGREFLAFYLQSKFKQVMAYDNKAEQPIFNGIKHDFKRGLVCHSVEKPRFYYTFKYILKLSE